MGTIEITRFGGEFRPTPRNFKDLKILIEQCDDLYPGINIWYKRKVIEGLKQKSRTAYLIYDNGLPVGATIAKLGKDSKICSLRILPEAEKKGYGRLLMALIARDLRKISEITHFTIPEQIWYQKSEFFKDYGFKFIKPASDQYRLFDQEFYCRGEFQLFWEKVVKTLPDLIKRVSINGVDFTYDIVMSMHSRHTRAIKSGQKSVEIRRKFSNKWVGSKTLVYSTKPDNCFVGTFRIGNIIKDEPDIIWNTFNDQIGCSKEEFSNYVGCEKNVYAIVISDFNEFKAPMPRTHLSTLVNSEISVPQSYFRYQENSALEEAISIGALIQSTL